MRRIMRILAICVIAYLVIVGLVLTPALNLVPSWYAKKYLNRDLSIDWVLFNPFALSLHVKNAEMKEHDGQRFAGLAGAEVNLSVESIWQQGWVFDRVAIDQLYLHVRKLTEDSFNFSDLIPPSEEPAPETEGEIPGVTIHNFDFSSERVMYTDETRAKPYSNLLDGLAINVVDLSTVLEDGKPYRLEATGPGGGRLEWEGLISLPQAHSEGSLGLLDINLPIIWRFIEPWASFEVADGSATVVGQYSVDWGESPAYKINQAELRVSQVAVVPSTADVPPDTSVALGELVLAGIDLDGTEQHVVVDSLTMDGLAIKGWSEGDKVSLTELFRLEMPEGDAADEEPAGDEAGWTAELKSIEVKDNSLHWRSEFTDPALLEVSPIEASIQAVKWPLEGDSPVKLALTINGQTNLSLDGSLGLAEGGGRLDYDLQELPVPWFNPNFPKALKVKITDGLLSVKGELGLAEWSPTTIMMDGLVSNFSGQIQDQDTEAALTAWETVRWDKLAVDMEKRSVDLAKLAIDDYTGRIHIREDGSINSQNLWDEELEKENGTPAEQSAETDPDSSAEDTDEQAGAAPQDQPTEVAEAEAGETAPASAEAETSETAKASDTAEASAEAETSETAEAGDTAEASAEAETSETAEASETAETSEAPGAGEQAPQQTAEISDDGPWSVNLALVQITDSEIDFMDESLPIVFRTVIGEVNGDITGLSSAAGSEAQVDIKGSVDSYAPVVLAGTVQPLTEPPAIDLLLTFAGIDMAMLSPYSATYAGYAIDRGLLNLDLKYALKDNRLDGNNKVLIDQMKLGEKVESEKAADIPLELALTLLTDSNGVIDLEVPVKGSVDDPEFRLGGVIWGAFVNLITKAVTAPFNLLAGLVGSEEDLQRVNFPSGSAELDTAGKAKLDQLGKALAQRPQLGLVITGRLQLEADRERLQRNILKGELLEAGLSQQELDSKGPEWEKAINARYQRLTPGASGLTAREQYQQLAEVIPLPDEALQTLARDRAAAVKTYLVTDLGLDSGRAVIEQTQLDDKANLYSGVELAIDT